MKKKSYAVPEGVSGGKAASVVPAYFTLSRMKSAKRWAAAVWGTPLKCTVWLDAETLLPRYAEFAADDAVVVSAKLLAFSCTLNEDAN